MLRKIGVACAMLACVSFASAVRLYEVGLREGLSFLEPGRTELMDMYYPLGARPEERFPGVVIIHGGGWNSGVRNADREVNIGSNLARMGYVCISIDYRVAQKGQKAFPVILQDCKKAVQWLRVHAEELQLDAKHIGCIGGSAGGHLATLLAFAGPDVGLEPTEPYPGVDSRVQACVNLYGIMDLFNWRQTQPDGTPLEGKLRMGGPRAMMGTREDQDRENWLKMSPLHQADRQDPPLLQIHGKADPIVDWWQARDMKARLDELGVENELLLLDGIGHTFSLQRWGGKALPKEVRQRVISFFDRHLRGCSPAEAEARFAALEALEAQRPEAAVYGQSGRGMNAQVVEFAQNVLKVRSPQGKEESFACNGVLTIERLERLAPNDFREGQRVEAQGKTLPDKQFACSKLIYRQDVPDAVGKVSLRGVLVRHGDGWGVDMGKRGGVYALRLASSGVRVSRREAGTPADVLSGRRIVYLEGICLGAPLRVSRLLLGELPEQPGKK